MSGSPVTTTINDNDLMALKLSGTSSVVEGGTASYDVKLDGVGLMVGQSVTMTLDLGLGHGDGSGRLCCWSRAGWWRAAG